MRSDLVWVVLPPGNQTVFLIVAPGSRWETSLTPIQSREVTHLILHWNNNNCKIDTGFCAEVGLLLLKGVSSLNQILKCMHSQHHTFQMLQILVLYYFFFKGLQLLDIRFDMNTLTNLRNIWQSNIFLFLFPTNRDLIKTNIRNFFSKCKMGICMCKWGKNCPTSQVHVFYS